MARRDYTVALALAGTVIAIVGGWLSRQAKAPIAGPGTNPPAAVTITPTNHNPAQPTADHTALFSDTLRELRAGGDAATDQARLQAFAANLTALGRERAVAVVREFLATGADAPTRLSFTLGNDGLLAGAPTVRVFLLDLLERLDPVAAAEQAKVILTTPTSADEWAVALRSLACGRPEERDLLAAKLRELLHNDAWRVAPSTGWLEAFDVAVHLGGSGFVPDLSALMGTAHGPAANHAAFLALDRLATREPVAVLSSLLDTPAVLAGREASRAGMFARADVQDPAQRALLERYLLAPARSPAELTAFAGVYPNANTFVSANLLTVTPVTNRDAIVRHDAFALTVIEGWLNDSRFVAIRPQLERMRMRLQEFVQQSRQGGN